MKKRQVFIVLGALVLIASIVLGKKIANSKQAPGSTESKKTKTSVTVNTIKLATHKAEVQIHGRLISKKRIDLISEVNGKLLPTDFDFREGNTFSSGQTLFSVDNTEAKLNLWSQKSAFLSQLNQLIVDMKMDFPESYEKWDKYISFFEIKKPLEDLPEVSSSKEKNFVVSRNIYNQFYNLKNLEHTLSKYTISAPFGGSVTLSSVNVGSIVRVGQKLGEIIADASIEMETSVSVGEHNYLSVGDSVLLKIPGESQTWVGKISRLAQNIDASTQTIKVFISVPNDSRLIEGVYLEGNILGKSVESAFEIDRKQLVDGRFIYTVNSDTILNKSEVEIMRTNGNKLLLKGLPEGTTYINENLPGAFDGMIVNVVKN